LGQAAWERILWKKTLDDAAIDGVIPQGELASPETMHKKLREALYMWIERGRKIRLCFDR